MPQENALLSQLFYISRSRSTPADVQAILEQARVLNCRRGLTGMLLFSGGHFAQVLEGPQALLAQTMEAIGQDRRHEALRILWESPIEQRRFAGWGMAFTEASGADELIQQLLLDPEVAPERAQRLLHRMFEQPPA